MRRIFELISGFVFSCVLSVPSLCQSRQKLKFRLWLREAEKSRLLIAAQTQKVVEEAEMERKKAIIGSCNIFITLQFHLSHLALNNVFWTAIIVLMFEVYLFHKGTKYIDEH